MKRKIALISLSIVVLILSTSLLCACSMSTYAKKLEKKGYVVVYSIVHEPRMRLVERHGDSEKYIPNEVEWAVTLVYTNGEEIDDFSMDMEGYDYVIITKYFDADNAINMYNRCKNASPQPEGIEVKRRGKIVFYGTKQGVKDAT